LAWRKGVVTIHITGRRTGLFIMTGKIQTLIVTTLIGFLLSSCQSPETPQQVAQHFWQAVIEDKPDKVVKYSTLVDVKDYDRFSTNWSGFQPSLGKITIEKNNASVVSQFTPPTGADLKERKLTTYLVMQNEEWKVDYQKTRDEMKTDKAGNLFGRLNQIGKKLQEQLENSADEFNSEMEQLGKKLQELSDQVGSDAAEGVEKFADELEKSIKELEESIDRALKDDRKQVPEQGEEDLQEV
jgi:gas vesicle protein